MGWLVLVYFLVVFALLALYARHLDQAILQIPPSHKNHVQKMWTDGEIAQAYRQVQEKPLDIRPFLFSTKKRRYIVVGGSGLVGSTIITHLIQRGEDPQAIRVLDLIKPTRVELVAANVSFVKVDVSDAASVLRAFEERWPSPNIEALPLTVFHTAAIIGAAERKALYLAPFVKININGTKNVVQAAKAAGASCLVATSSSSVGMVPTSKWPWPWQTWPKDFCQTIPNADRKSMDDPLERFAGCYPWSKAQAEMLVRNADSRELNFRTGCIRPGHAIYGVGVENPSSLTWDYLRRGGAVSWLFNAVANFVCADNVSIGHLALENALINGGANGQDVGGRAYCVTDPNPPITFAHVYRTLELLAHPSTPVRFTKTPYSPMLVLSYVFETLDVLRRTRIPFLPEIKGDLAQLKPGLHNIVSIHLIYSDQKAKDEILYEAPIGSLQGFAHAVLDWNINIEKRKL